jgi:signal transduction histidine kinase
MLLPDALRSRHQSHRASYTEQPRARVMGQGLDLVARRKDGSEFPIEISLSCIGEPPGMLVTAFVSDITARKEAERALLARNEDLARALASAREVLHDRKAGDINAIQEEFLGDSLRSARQLLALINDLLDLEKIAAGRRDLNRERFDVHQLVRETVHEVSVIAAANRVRLLAEPEDSVRWVMLDRQKTKQVLLNLATNAVKFTPEGGLVTVRARGAGSERWVLEVQDTGIGISEQDQKRLFHEFEQLETSSSKRFQGTGLGLVLARSMVEAQGGSLSVVSREGVGSTFFALLPVILERRKAGGSPVLNNRGDRPFDERRRAERAEGCEPPPDSFSANEPVECAPDEPEEAWEDSAPLPGERRHILLLDDDPNIHKLLKLELRDSGLKLVGCPDGESGLIEFGRATPAAVVVDLMMPNLDGFNFIARLRQEFPHARTVPLFVWTSLDLSSREMEGLRGAVRQVIGKSNGGIGRLNRELRKELLATARDWEIVQ